MTVPAGAHDIFLALSDRIRLMDRLRQEIFRVPASDALLGMVVIDLAGVAQVDSIYGYHAGDRLLQEIAGRLAGALRQGDGLGSITREHFGCILPALPGEGYATLAAHKILRTFEQPFVIAEQEILVNPTLGISLYPAHANDAENMIRQANAAMRAAKSSRSGFALYDAALEEASRLQFELLADFRRAIEDNALALFFQPQLDLRSGRVVGSEALLRWNHPSRGAVSAATVVALAENGGLIAPLTAWVFNTAFRHCADFQRAGMEVDVSVNLSAHNLREPELPEFIDQLLNTWHVPAGMITVELTESAMLENPEAATETLLRLKAIGMKLSMDDFGTGFSSLSHLHRLPFDELKIDQSFVKTMTTSRESEKIVRAVIDLGHNFGLTVVAEGVEDEATLKRLTKLGCDRIQGYWLSRPIEEAAFRDFVARRQVSLRA